MPTTPTKHRPRLSVPMSPADVEASERALFNQLQTALAPSFVLVRRLGAGGMGIVYLARDPRLKRLVAVKVMAPDMGKDPEARARFQREAEAVAAISHPNVVAVHGVGTLPNGLPYLVMQYVDGPTMAERVKDEGPLDLSTAKLVIGQVASALEAAHRKGIIHRDIKGSNILWDDASGRALVSDFGIAAIFESDFDTETMRITHDGVVMGTPRYMSPEQLLQEPVTAKTDIYSLGLLGYELLTGDSPYPGMTGATTSSRDIISAHLRDLPRPVSIMRPDVDPELESILRACLEKDAHGRPDAEDVARRLARGNSILLEWPPPGLESLHGALERPLWRLIGGAFAVAAPLTVAALAGRASILRLPFPQVLLLPSIAAIGGISVVIATVEMMQLLREAVRGARAGYGWTTIAEVLVDKARDTGALISGEREFASFTIAERSELRRNRVLAGLLRVGSALWALLSFFVALPVAARLAVGPTALALWTLGVPVLALLAARALERRESKMLAGVRERIRKHRGPLDRLTHLASTWRSSFDRLLQGVGLGHGVTGRVRRRAVAIAGAATLAVAATVTAYSLVTISVMGEVTQATRLPRFSSIWTKHAQIERLRSFRTPIDPSVTPLDAGYAIQSIEWSGNPSSTPTRLAARFPIPRIAPIPPSGKTPVPGGLYGGRVIRLAKAGFTAEQRAFLESRANQPGAKEWATIARSSWADYQTASLPNPLPPGTKLEAMEIPRYSTIKTVAYDQAARAALAFADGKPAEAERLLRETIGVGFSMIEGTALLDNLIGISIVREARDNLVALYQLTGRADAARAFSTETDPTSDVTHIDPDYQNMGPEARDAWVHGIMKDQRSMRGLRWEFTRVASFEPCSNLPQILFGADQAHTQLMSDARTSLVRSPGESEMMGLIENELDHPMNDAYWPHSVVARSLKGFAKAVDAVSGNHRLTSCTVFSLFDY